MWLPGGPGRGPVEMEDPPPPAAPATAPDDKDKGSAHTTEATRTGPTAKRAAATRRTLRGAGRVTVQGPVRKPTKDGMSHRRGGGGSTPNPLLKYWAKIFSGPSADQNFSLAPMILDQEFRQRL